MIEYAIFDGNSGVSVQMGWQTKFPLSKFAIQTSVKRDPVTRFQHHGQWPAKSYLDAMSIDIEGDVLGDDANDYWQLRQTFMAAFMPTAELGYVNVGRLRVLFSGMEEVFADCDLDSNEPVIPMEAGYPAYGAFQAQLISPKSLFFSTVELSTNISAASSQQGITFPVTFPLTLAGGASADAVVTNAGNASVAPVVTITGPVQTPGIGIVLPTGRKNIILNSILQTGENITIDFEARTIIRNGSVNAYSDLASGLSDWWEIPPGKWTVIYSSYSASPPSSAIVNWRNAYIL